MKNKTTAKVLHHQTSNVTSFHMSLKAIEKKVVQEGAMIRYFLPREGSTHSFISLRVKKGMVEKTYFFDPCEELLKLPHEKVQQ